MDYPKSDASARLLNDKFTDGDPINDIPASKDSADYQNMVFDELINLIVGAGLTPDENDLGQILSAVRAGGQPTKNFQLNDWAPLPGGLILQWGISAAITSGGSVGITFPIAFPGLLLAVAPTGRSSSYSSSLSGVISNDTVTGFTLGSFSSSGLTRAYGWIALGK